MYWPCPSSALLETPKTRIDASVSAGLCVWQRFGDGLKTGPLEWASPELQCRLGDKLTTQERVVEALFPGKHLTSREECPEEGYSMSLKEQRASGYFLPGVLQAVAGAFTAPRTN